MHTATNPTGFDDFTNDLDEEGSPVHNPTEYTPATFTEVCKKCGGKGYVTFGYVHIQRGTCFACKGVGSFTRKTSPEKRAARAQARVERKAKEAQAVRDTGAEWLAANPAIATWLETNAPRSGFAADLLASVAKWGHLTPGQAAAVERSIAKDAAYVAEKAAREAAAPVVCVDALQAAFDNAKAQGKSRISVTLGSLKVKPAKAHEGVLYVTENGEYLGKVKSNQFLRVRSCTPEQEAIVLRLLADPKAALEVYGKETGVCGICNRTLTDPESIANGIGPVCARGFGW